MKHFPQSPIFAPYFKTFIQERVEKLAFEGEKLPEFLKEKEELDLLRKQAAEAMDIEDVDSLINVARGLDIFIYEYIYQAGVMDGIKVSSLIEQVKKG